MAERQSSTTISARSRSGRDAPVKQKEVPIQVMVPESVRRQVAVMGAERGENLRTIVLRALQAIGVDVSTSELGERRGRRREEREAGNGTK
jgi:hypothetical protein